MSSRIKLTLSPSVSAGLLATAPWVALASFSAAAALESSPLMLAFMIPAGLLGWKSFRHHGLLQNPNSVIAITGDQTGLLCQLANGTEIPITICGSSHLSSALVIMKFRPAGRRSGSMVTLITGNIGPFRSNASEPDFRRLRMILRASQPEHPRRTPSH